MPVEGSDEQKRTNEIRMAIPVLETCDINGKDITADALLTQRSLAEYIVDKGAHYHFIAKGNQAALEEDIALLFAQRKKADFIDKDFGHGRIETRSIWCSSELNDYLDFPHVGQVFLIEREVIQKKTGKATVEIALGLTSRTQEDASPERLLHINRAHWKIEAMHYIIDYNYDEDHCRIRTGNGPECMTRLRRFAIGILKQFQKPTQSIAGMMQDLCQKPRRVFDYLRMTKNSAGVKLNLCKGL